MSRIIHKIAISLTAIGLSTQVATAQTFTVMGGGTSSCFELNRSNEARITFFESWILGFWSGLNASLDPKQQAGGSLPNDTITSYVQAFCSEHPSSSISSATMTVFTSMSGK